MNTGPLNLFSHTLSEKTLSDKNFVQRKLFFDEHETLREKENADLVKTSVEQGFAYYLILQPWLGFLETR